MNTEPEDQKRTAAYRVDESLLHFLKNLNSALAPLEAKLRSEVVPASLPITIVGGLQRSGTTLLSQLLAKYCEVSCIDNLVARFWQTPLVGAMFARSMFGSSGPPASNFVSDYGVTQGIREPHEFGYFWTDWLHLDRTATHLLTDDEASQVAWANLARCLRQISGVSGLPLVMKNPTACWNARWLFSEYAGFRAIVVRRDLFFVVQSTYLARRERYGDVGSWWSLKPPSYESIRKEPDPIRQVAAQVYESHRIFEAMLKNHPNRCIAVSYQDVRQKTEVVLERLCEFCGWQIRKDLVLPSADDLPDGDQCRVSPEEARRMEEALQDLGA